jgi:DNA-binding transcriptional ArsR family regulator
MSQETVIQIKNTGIKTVNTCIRTCPDVEMINSGRVLIEENLNSISAIAKTLSLTGNETRLKILYLIYKKQQVCVCDLSDMLDISISAISQQLKKLKLGGLITDNKVGKTVYYSISNENLESLVTIFIQINKYQ